MESKTNKNIVTGVDKFLNIINERGIVTLSEISNELCVEKEIIEHWSEALAEQGVIKIKFGIKDILLMTPEHFNMEHKNTSIIQEIFSMNSYNLKFNKDEKDIYLMNRERELDKRSKKVLETMKNISSTNLGLQKRKNDLILKEKEIIKSLLECEKIEKLQRNKEREIQHKCKLVEWAYQENKKKQQEIKMLKIQLETGKKENNIIKKALVKQKKELLIGIKQFNKLKKQESTILNKILKAKQIQLKIETDTENKKNSLIKRVNEIKKGELKVVTEKNKIKELKFTLKKKMIQFRKGLKGLQYKEKALNERELVLKKRIKESESFLNMSTESQPFKEIIHDNLKSSVAQNQ